MDKKILRRNFILLILFVANLLFGISFLNASLLNKSVLLAEDSKVELTFDNNTTQYGSLSQAVEYVNNLSTSNNTILIEILQHDNSVVSFSNKSSTITIKSKGETAFNLNQITNEGNRITFVNVNISKLIANDSSMIIFNGGSIDTYQGNDGSKINFLAGTITTAELASTDENTNFAGIDGTCQTINSTGEKANIYIAEKFVPSNINLAEKSKIFVETGLTEISETNKIAVTVDSGVDYGNSNPVVTFSDSSLFNQNLFDITVPDGFELTNDDDNTKLFFRQETIEYLYNGTSQWENNFITYLVSQTNGLSSVSNIKSIAFNNTIPADYNGSFSVGTSNLTSGEVNTNSSIVAYWSQNGTDFYYNIVNKKGGCVYAPENCNYMFYNCSSLTSLNLEKFDTSNAITMNAMFSVCNSLTTLDISTFDTSNVTSMSNMFYFCNGLTTLDISNFDTSNVTDMSGMFGVCYGLLGTVGPNGTAIKFGENFNTSNVIDMTGMFSFSSSLTSIDLSSFNTSKTEKMGGLFSYCGGLSGTVGPNGTAIKFGDNFDTSNTTLMEHMFNGCSGLTSIDLRSFSTLYASSMTGMFKSCSELITIDLSSFDMRNVTLADGFVLGCDALKTIKTPKKMCSFSIELPTKTDCNFYDTSNSNEQKTVIQGGLTSSHIYKIGYEITANTNGGTITSANGWNVENPATTATKVVLWDETISVLPTATKQTYIFQKWTKDNSESAEEITTPYSPSSNGTIFAQWTENIIEGSLNSIDGDIVYGETLSLDITNSSNANLTYQWYASDVNETQNGTAIDGAIDATYKIGQGLIGKYIYVEVTASLDGYDNVVWKKATGTAVGKRTIKVTVTGASKEFDGEILTLAYSTEGELAEAHTFNQGMTEYLDVIQVSNLSTTTENVGSETITPTVAITHNSSDITDEYDVQIISGTATITAKSVTDTISIADDLTYGNEITANFDSKYQVSNFVWGYANSSTDTPTTIQNQNTNTLKLTAQTFDIDVVAGKYIFVTAELTGNYSGTLSFVSETPIEQKILTWSSNPQANSKNYDGNSNATISNYGTISGVLDGDVCELDTNLVSATFDDASAGKNKTVTFDGFALTGKNSKNYILAETPTAVADITSVGINYTATENTTIQYDGQSHGIEVVVNNPQSATIKFGIDENNIQDNSSPTITNVGSLTVWVEISAENYDTAKFSRTITIEKRVLTKPQIVGTYEYNQTNQTASLEGFDGSIMSLSGDSITQKDAGEYITKIELKDANNYCWQDDENSSFDIKWEISPKTITANWTNNSPYTFKGTHQSPTASIENVGNVSFELSYKYFDSNNNVVIETIENGEYSVEISLSTVNNDLAKNYVISNPTENYLIGLNKLTNPTNLSWNKGIASWTSSTEISGIDISYNIELFKDGNSIDTKSTTDCQYDFTETLKNLGKGEYTFNIQAMSSDTTNCLNSDVQTSEKQVVSIIKANLTTGVSSILIADQSQIVAISGEDNISIVANFVDGYEFDKWQENSKIQFANSNSNPTTFAYNSTESEEITIEVVANAKQYSVSFNANGGTGGQTESVTATYGEDMPSISTIAPTRSGYTFVGWYDNADYTLGAQYYDKTGASSTTYNKTTATTLYAGWSKNRYTIKFDTMFSTITQQDLYVYFDDDIDWPILSLVGYTFDGWFDQKVDNNGAGENISATWTKMPVIEQAEKTVYAKWTPNGDTKYVVKHFKQNLDGQTYSLFASDEFSGVSNAEITPNPNIYEGFVTPNKQTVTINPDGSTIVEYQYKRQKFTFTLNQVTGLDLSQSTQSGELYFEQEITLEASALAGYEFESWYDGLTDSSTKITMPASSLTITPSVNKISYSINYNLNGGTVIGNREKYTVTDEFDILEPEKLGYVFVGWTGSNGTTPQKDLKIEVGTIGNKTFTANYIPADNTEYKVNHYLQNVDGNGYTLKETETKTGETDSTVIPEFSQEYEGFTPDGKVKQITINADGSSYVDYYYSRNKYQVVWKNYNGDELLSKLEYYGAMPTFDLEDPTKPSEAKYHYEFAGWSPTAETVKVYAEPKVYTAQFNPVLRNYELKIKTTFNVATAQTITFNVNGDIIAMNEQSNISTLNINYGETVNIFAQIAQTSKKYNLSWIDSSISTNDYTNITHNQITITDNTQIELFVTEIFNIQVVSNNEDMGYISSLDNLRVLYGRTFSEEIEAVANKGYKFVNWTNADNSFAIDNKNDLITTISNIRSSGELVANFDFITYTIKLEVDGRVEEIEYNISKAVEIKAPEDTTNKFIGWIENEDDIPTETINIKKGSIGNRTFHAVFDKEPFNFVLVAIIAGGVVGLAGLVTTIIVIVKKKKKNKRRKMINTNFNPFIKK